jgi:hypothetical protein
VKCTRLLRLLRLLLLLLLFDDSQEPHKDG